MTALHQTLDHLPDTAQGCVLVIGNFDGVHLGHRALIEKARSIAHQQQRPLGVLTFEPHPRQFFQPSAEPFRLTLLPMKKRIMEGLGVDHLFALPFDKALSVLSADEFIDTILVQKLKVKHVVVGEDFAFGCNRSGTVDTLKAASAKFALDVVKSVAAPQGETYSSTAIRSLLRQGHLDAAAALLGWPWQIEAPVVKGDQRGRLLGYPTANQNMTDYVRIPYGIYAVRAQVEGDSAWYNGVANFGIRPMFETPQPLFETFIFDFSEEIYGKNLRVQPVKFLRPELSFQNIEGLIAQMKEDCITAKAVLKSTQIS